ncbi:uncharacterized protein LOC142175382 [Nicotiana tabacum]|uniref:Uncharacterized protein LOC142175382 n=1 Tax=Nicotiana tabacum TaxID=4097 RepID=A0AC58TLG5_TOBAC
MASSGLSLNTPQTFTGENYQIWSVKMKSYLEAYDLWEVVMEDKLIQPLPTNPTLAQIKAYSDEKTKKYKAKTIIQNSVTDSIFSKIIACETVKEAWKTLKQELLGDDFKDDRIVEKLLVTIPESFESKISSLEESKDLSTIFVVELISVLQAQEQRRAFRQDKITEYFVMRNSKKKKSIILIANIAHLEKFCWWRPDTLCENCKQKGHVTKVCKFKDAHAQALIAEEGNEDGLL